MCGQSTVYNTYATLLPTNPLFQGFSRSKTLVFGNKIIKTSGTELFPMFFYILVLGDLDSNFLYYGQPIMVS